MGSSPTTGIRIFSPELHGSGLFLLPNGLHSGFLQVKRKDRICRRDLAAVIQMGVDVGSRSNITVTQPFLDFFQTDAVCVKQAGAAVT